ncbi:ABC transporter ATP-binding protein [Roseibium denhamense]|uniref:Spermidine/putrescine transport system ATP-binding protein n=1 Tax=Roseibium denhamense TaxID=76305 RepID=A0ABY1PHH1_9HYPH|nr:ABC transporter ATP-binding protein [Roseibium denhamense]MTI05593.1 ABC transporter ATP-binding protein [Roseibium denhamense]SMP34536.1 putative spermidine/putrescine transport system ATP-binding protein [Roseibium denhamense]
MSGLQLVDITKRYGAVTAVDGISLEIEDGAFVCLLGPSGCGKTTLLRMIAGLEDPSAGDISLQGARINDMPAHKRNLGMVFQSLALFPHLTIGENIAYPLKIRGNSRADCEARVRDLLDMVQLPGIENRSTAQLSGGQRQRVAIARALAVSPQLFLLDEPLSALDAKLREAMQVELRQLQQRLGITTIVVTHDQREAMSMSDKIVVMSNGKVEQMAAPIEAYKKPASPFVADFLGQANLIRVQKAESGAALSGGRVPGLSLGPRNEALISIRPEDVVIKGGGEGPLPADVVFIREMGATVEVHLDAGADRIIALAPPKRDGGLKVGARVSIDLPADACVVFDSREAV